MYIHLHQDIVLDCFVLIVHVHLIPRSKDDSAGSVHSMFSQKIELSESEVDELCSKLQIN